MRSQEDFSGSRSRNPRARGGSGEEWLYGRRPVLEALLAGRRQVFEAMLPAPARNEAAEIVALRDLLQARQTPIARFDRDVLNGVCAGGNHQGVAVRVEPFVYTPFDDVLDRVAARADALVLMLDHIEDPQNVGSLLRTADAAGVVAVVLPEDRACGVTPAVVRASAGASEHVPVARVVNFARAMRALQNAGMWITGLDMGPEARVYTEVDFAGRAALVVGGEGRGVSRLARETCDFMASLPMRGRVASLNAGVAGAIALYEALRQRGGAAPSQGQGNTSNRKEDHASDRG